MILLSKPSSRAAPLKSSECAFSRKLPTVTLIPLSFKCYEVGKNTHDAHSWFEDHIQKQFLASKNTMYDLEKVAALLDLDTTDWFLATDELKFKSYGTIDLDGKLRHELVINLVKEIDTPEHKLLGQFRTTELCNSPDRANASVYKSLGFNCDAPLNKKEFCEDIRTAL